MAAHAHVIPVDPSLEPMDAWKEICIFGQRVTYTADREGWAVITCGGQECGSGTWGG